MLQAVLFDLDGTLLDRETSVRNCIENQFVRFASQLFPIGIAEFVSLFGALDQRGYSPKPLVYEQMAVKLNLSVSLSRALTVDYFAAYPKFCVGFPNLIETLTWMRERGLKPGIVTNGTCSLQTAAIRALGINPLFDTVVISEAEGVRKPDRGIFELALARPGIPATDAVFVGDHPDADIRGAQQARLRAIWKRDDYWGACSFADAEVEELNDLPGVLTRFGV
jgi:putative hydrolase of the HAD superfamily